MTILALLEFLQLSQVSVGLFLLAETHGNTDGDLIQVIQVESSPLDLSTASFAIAHPSFARQLTYAMAYKMDGFNGMWGSLYNHRDYVKLLGKAIGMTELDVYVEPPKSWDQLIMNNPEKWLEQRIQTIKEHL
jgi:hypothetical protein